MSNSEESEIKVTNDGWVIIFKDDNENIPQTLIDDIIRKHKHIHAIFTLQKELLQQTRVKKFLDNFTGKIYVYNYCNDLEHAYLVADACEMIATKPDVELLYHIPVTFPESKQPMKDDEMNYEPNKATETASLTMSFEEAIKVAKRGTPVRALNWPVQSFIGVTDGQVVLAENIWSKHNRTFAEQNGGLAVVYNSFTKNVNGVITMGWVPTNEDLWDTWVVHGTALYPQKIMLSEDLDELAIDFSLSQGKGLYSDTHAFAGPFHLFYETIFNIVKNYGKAAFITADHTSERKDAFETILDLMVVYHDESIAESLSVNDNVGLYNRSYLTFDEEYNIGVNDYGNKSDLKHLTQRVYNFIKENEINAVVVDLDSFDSKGFEIDAVVDALNEVVEENRIFSWVSLSLKDNTEPYKF